MALSTDLQKAPKTDQQLSVGSTGELYSEILRDYVARPGVSWRYGLPPNYEKVNATFYELRSKRHKEGTLEHLAQKIVKNWEVDSRHVLKPEDWTTMNVEKFKISVNGGPKANAQTMADAGPCMALLGDVPGMFYASQTTFASTNRNFSEAFPEGFAWECLEVYYGLPKVTFKWRHFGRFLGTWTSPDGTVYKGTGEVLELVGMCVATVDDDLKINELEIFYNPLEMILPLMKGKVVPPPEPEPRGFFATLTGR
eukprot:TRINITY_DN7848_c0_g1_i1.p1 TRINITY_DN7848_c0_g1~~TRINITY_DN7848_c0_g1_i1.p1  ORF type:complete len:288 (-),score=32.23 TRINITY_DN7848_c0_g1_i1:252-1013(-)